MCRIHQLPRLLLVCLILGLSACALLSPRDPLIVQVAGIEPLAGEGLEMRLLVKLRVQNPNDVLLDFNGIALELDIDGRRLASGVSDQRGSIPRYGETLVQVPVTISAVAVTRNLIGLAEWLDQEQLPYVLRGKLAGGLLGTQRFAEKGTLRLPRIDISPYQRMP